MSDDINNLKTTLAELGWTTTVSTPPNLACEALRTLHAALDRRKAEADVARAEIWKYKNALRNALDLAARALEEADEYGNPEAPSTHDHRAFVEKQTAKLAELQRVLDGQPDQRFCRICKAVLGHERDTPTHCYGHTDEELHREELHPDFEYETTRTGRKSGDSLKPEGEGWEPNLCVAVHRYEDGKVVEERWRNWERFEFHEEEHWKRRKPK